MLDHLEPEATIFTGHRGSRVQVDVNLGMAQSSTAAVTGDLGTGWAVAAAQRQQQTLLTTRFVHMMTGCLAMRSIAH